MKIVYNRLIPFPGYVAINLFGVLFVREGYKLSEKALNHERIHTAQMKELFYIGFYLWYLIEYILIHLSLWCGQSYAYHDISFEEEAYLNESNLNYLSTRRKFAWWKYIQIGSWGG